VTLRKSTVGTHASARGTVRALGLRRIGQSVELPDDPAVRGQVRAVRYLVEVEEVGDLAAEAGTPSRSSKTKETTS
jgi:large subunit ribosomal protein L30